jgi:putative heme-binding domain-containing protein
MDPHRALFSDHRPLRESAARRLTSDEPGRTFRRENLGTPDVRVRAAALTALLDADDRKLDLSAFAEEEPLGPLRALAVRALAERGEDVSRFLEAKQPPSVRRAAIATLKGKSAPSRLLEFLADADPFLRCAAVHQLGDQSNLLATFDPSALKDPVRRIGLLLAWRASGRDEGLRRLPTFLDDVDEDVRFLAVKWIADLKLTDYRPRIAAMLKERGVNVRLFLACSSALARLDDRDVSEASMADYFLDRLQDDKTPTTLRVLALQMIPSNHPKLTINLLDRLLSLKEPSLRLEAARALCERLDTAGERPLHAAARDEQLENAVRAQAVLGLSMQAPKYLDDLLRLAHGGNDQLRAEALRAVKDTRLDTGQRAGLEAVARRHPRDAELVARVLGQPFVKDRPRPDDLDGWLKHLDGPADAGAGRRVFFHPKLAGCFRCHRVEGRGQDVGPDLSTIGRTDRRHILESLLRPSNLVAPHYQVWQIETADGKVRTGMLVRTVLDEYTYVDAKGELFKLNTRTIAETRPVPVSIMPDGLSDLLTDQELRDLLAYLCALR